MSEIQQTSFLKNMAKRKKKTFFEIRKDAFRYLFHMKLVKL